MKVYIPKEYTEEGDAIVDIGTEEILIDLSDRPQEIEVPTVDEVLNNLNG